MARRRPDFPFRGHAVLIWGSLVATLLGVFTAVQLDLVIAAGERLTHPAGQAALISTTTTAGATGLVCWAVCALVTRAVSRAAVKPYEAITDQVERLADGRADGFVDPGGPPAARRLGRAVAVMCQQVLASRVSEAELRMRYDSLLQEQADERRILMGMLLGGRLAPDSQACASPTVQFSPGEFDIPLPPFHQMHATGSPAPDAGCYDSLYHDDPAERRQLIEMLLSKRFDCGGHA